MIEFVRTEDINPRSGCKSVFWQGRGETIGATIRARDSEVHIIYCHGDITDYVDIEIIKAALDEAWDEHLRLATSVASGDKGGAS